MYNYLLGKLEEIDSFHQAKLVCKEKAQGLADIKKKKSNFMERQVILYTAQKI